MNAISNYPIRFGAIHIIGPQTQRRCEETLNAVERLGVGDTIMTMRSTAFRDFFAEVTGDPELKTPQGPMYFNGPTIGESRYVLTDTDSTDRSSLKTSAHYDPAAIEKLQARIDSGKSRVKTYA